MKRINLREWEKRGEEIVLLGETFHRAARVLRVKTGDTLLGTPGSGEEYVLTVSGVLPDRITARIEALGYHRGEPRLRITLAQVVPRHSRMDLVIQKATELGVSRIVPLTGERSVSRPGRDAGGRLARWGRIAAEAVAQSRRSSRPLIEPPRSLQAFLAEPSEDLRLVLEPGPRAIPFSQLPEQPPGGVTVLVGPEGGLSPGELEAAVRSGFVAVRLGPRVLRAETAALAVVALVQNRWGDLG